MFENMRGEKIEVDNPGLPESWEGVFSEGEILLFVADCWFFVAEFLSLEDGYIRLFSNVGSSFFSDCALECVDSIVEFADSFEIYRCPNKLYNLILLSSMDDRNDIVLFP